MPFVKLNTNVEVADKPALLRSLSHVAVKETGKPENYVMVEINDRSDMLFAGQHTPLAYLECKSIGLTEKQAKGLSAAFCQLVSTQLNIAADRIYIEFSNAPAAFWGYNGSTFG
jgi:phenylpyruvate tautomerase PptA (4-oxalocrotonate tautomerase family)